MDITATFRSTVHHLRLSKGIHSISGDSSSNAHKHNQSKFLTAAVHFYKRLALVRDLVDIQETSILPDGKTSQISKLSSGKILRPVNDSFSGDLASIVQSFNSEAVPALKVLHGIIEQIIKDGATAEMKDCISFYQGIVIFLQEQLKKLESRSKLIQKLKDMKSEEMERILNPLKFVEDDRPIFADVDYSNPNDASSRSPPTPVDQKEHTMLQDQNQAYLKSFDSELSQAKYVESQVEQISSLVTEFSTQVHQQQELIDKISKDTKTSTENARKAESELEKALRNQSVSRKITLVFLLMATFSLMFLHWYEP